MAVSLYDVIQDKIAISHIGQILFLFLTVTVDRNNL